MNYEIHITLEVSNIDKFIKDCKLLNIKPIIIETQKDNIFINQIMTSSKYNDNDYISTMNNLISKLEKNYNIIRSKIEVQPLSKKNLEHLYYESHFRLKLPINFSVKGISDLCEKYNFHLSKNLFKKDLNFKYQMITYRNNNISFEGFSKILNKMKRELILINIIYDKIEIEECIFDSNEILDQSWIYG